MRAKINVLKVYILLFNYTVFSHYLLKIVNKVFFLFPVYFQETETRILTGPRPFTLKNDVTMLENEEFIVFGQYLALALVYGCAGPHNLQEAIASQIVGVYACIITLLFKVPFTSYKNEEKVHPFRFGVGFSNP